MSPDARRPNKKMDEVAVARLVAMREGGASWKDIGREFGKQDAVCSQIYTRAKAAAAASSVPAGETERQAATLSPCAR